MLFGRNRLAILLEYLTVLLEYIDALSMQHGICIGGLSPAPLAPPVLPPLNDMLYGNITMYALGGYIIYGYYKRGTCDNIIIS